jgi:ribonuclease VapC
VIVDSSALIAILRAEPDAGTFTQAMEDATRVRISAATLLESLMVAGSNRRQELRQLLTEAGADIVHFDEKQLNAALQGHDRFGKGSGSAARLNFGDCFSYALAKSLDEPLLFKGDDFTHTDVRSALAEEAFGEEIADHDEIAGQVLGIAPQ